VGDFKLFFWLGMKTWASRK